MIYRYTLPSGLSYIGFTSQGRLKREGFGNIIPMWGYIKNERFYTHLLACRFKCTYTTLPDTWSEADYIMFYGTDNHIIGFNKITNKPGHIIDPFYLSPKYDIYKKEMKDLIAKFIHAYKYAKSSHYTTIYNYSRVAQKLIEKYEYE